MYLDTELYNDLLHNAERDKHEPEQLMTRKAAAKYLGFMPNTLCAWDYTKKHDLKPLKIGRSIRYRKSVLDEFLDNMMKP